MKKHRYTKCYRCDKKAKLNKCKYCGNYFCDEHSNSKDHVCHAYEELRDEREKTLLNKITNVFNIWDWERKEEKRKRFGVEPSIPYEVRPSHKIKIPVKSIVVIVILVGIIFYLVNNQQIIYTVYNELGSLASNLPSFKPKPTYYCDSGNSTCYSIERNLINNCTDSTITEDTTSATTIIDITNRKDFCTIKYTIDKAAFYYSKGTSMTCDIPMNKISLATDNQYAFELLKYCEGLLKDKALELWGNLFGLPIS
jgi:hypothetical protein